MESFLKDHARLDAMFNYESMIIAANQRLVQEGAPPLFIIYPVDGLAVADCTLGFVNRPGLSDNQKKKDAFIRWRNCLLTDAIQTRILQTGFRTGLIGMNPAGAPAGVFNPAWGIDLGRTISPVPWPDAAVTLQALTLYQTAFRKPSLTAFALDCSGSMKSGGLDQLKNALRLLFDPATASEYFIQTGAEDITVVIPFHRGLVWEKPLVVTGNSRQELETLVRRIESLSADGNTDIYNPVSAAWDAFASLGPGIRRYLPSVILMTDGQSNAGSLEWLLSRWTQKAAGFEMPPVFCIMYGEASDDQLQRLARATSGRVFDGRKDGLEKAFREAKGYN
jgi:Ca-activated chloride channel family protein